MEQNREPRNKSRINLVNCALMKEQYSEEKTSFQQMVLEQPNIHMQKKCWLKHRQYSDQDLPYTLHKS